MNTTLERLVRSRAANRCEYCLLPQEGSQATFAIDHIIARQHRGRTVAGNPALSCVYCNGRKGPNLAGRDPSSGRLTRLFHPRRHKWSYHFRYAGGLLVGQTAIGRTTVDVLRINDPSLVVLRELLIAAGQF